MLIFPENHLLRLLCLFNPCGPRPTRFEKFLPLITIVASLMLITPNVLYIFFGATDHIDAMEAACTSSTGTLTFLKLTFCCYNREKIRLLNNKLQDEFARRKNSIWCEPDEFILVNKSKKFCRWITILYGGSLFTIALLYSIVQLLQFSFHWIFNSFPVDYQLQFPYKVM